MSLTERARVEVPIGSRGFLGVEASTAESDLSGPIYAVNLLDRKRPWAYELYGLLVVRSVLKSGARILFKGHRERVLLGDPAESRETLLIVRYPNPEAFLNMVRRPYFAAMSLFRRVGLGDFRFGFVRREGNQPEIPARPRPYAGDGSYLLTVFRGDPGELPSAPGTFFAGETVGTMCVRGSEATECRPTKLAPPLGWDAVLVEQGSEGELEETLRDRRVGMLANAEGASCVLYRRKL